MRDLLDKLFKTKSYRWSVPRGVLFAAAAMLLLSACSTKQLLDVALAKDPKAALKSMGQHKVERYKRDPQALLADFDKLSAVVYGDAARVWVRP
jgi:hypothetical protein